MFNHKIAAVYDDWYKTSRGNFIDKIETDAAFDLFKPEKDITILDVGCGTGNFSIKLFNQGSKVTGIDISEEMLYIARQKAQQQALDIEFKQMDLYSLTFSDNHFDAVFSMAAFEFIKEPHKAYKELYRVVKPGGQILIGTINRDSSWGESYLQIAKNDPNSVFRYADFKNLEELKALDTDNLVDYRECLFIPPNADEDMFSLEKEKELSSFKPGGFIICLWQKPRE